MAAPIYVLTHSVVRLGAPLSPQSGSTSWCGTTPAAEGKRSGTYFVFPEAPSSYLRGKPGYRRQELGKSMSHNATRSIAGGKRANLGLLRVLCHSAPRVSLYLGQLVYRHLLLIIYIYALSLPLLIICDFLL